MKDGKMTNETFATVEQVKDPWKVANPE
jgi:hypothetical protein